MFPPSIADEPVRILLVEEYDALALAIELALRKFSPGCEIKRYGNVAEAWVSAQRRPPRLVVLDHDPPCTGAIEFLQDLRELAPDARLLLLAGTSRRGQIADLGGVGVLRLVEKPFDLHQLGDAVRSQLEPNGPKRLEDFALSDCIALACLAAASVRLEVSSFGHGAGAIDLLRGQIRHAQTEREEGEEALAELLQVSKPLCRGLSFPSAVARSIKGDWIEVLTRLSSRPTPASAKPVLAHAAVRSRAVAEIHPEPVALRHDAARESEQAVSPKKESYSPPKSENGSVNISEVSPKEADWERSGGAKEPEYGREGSPPESATMATLELPLEVFAVEITALVKIGLVRARLADDGCATLRIPTIPGGAGYLLETGFRLEEIELDSTGHISTLDLHPALRVAPAKVNGQLAIGGISVAPDEHRWRLFFTENQTLRLQLMLSVQLVALTLSPEIEVRQLTVRCHSSDMRVALHPSADSPEGAARFRAVTIELDDSRRLQELALAPVF